MRAAFYFDDVAVRAASAASRWTRHAVLRRVNLRKLLLYAPTGVDDHGRARRAEAWLDLGGPVNAAEYADVYEGSTRIYGSPASTDAMCRIHCPTTGTTTSP